MKKKRENLTKEQLIYNLTPQGKVEQFIRKFHSGPLGLRVSFDHKIKIQAIRKAGEEAYKKLSDKAGKELKPLQEKIKEMEDKFNKEIEEELLKHMTKEMKFIQDVVIPDLEK